ncbi:MAG: TIGR04086 family membrane protein [Lachnospiraceae bacterium]|nr:TIGR04086 family membrane protein [Lachnospiraceae bacterium]
MPQILFTLKCLLFSYILTGGLLLLLALLLYKLHLSEKAVNAAIILIYVAASFFAGFVTGKKTGTKKFFWGAAMGALYFAILFVISAVVNRSFPQLSSDFTTTMLLCVGGGMLGGMLS